MSNNLIDELTDKVNDGYSALSKWLISLSSGVIVFSINLITPETDAQTKLILLCGLGLLVITILLGVLYVRFGIDAIHYNLMCIGLDEQKEELKNVKDSAEKEKFSKKRDRLHNKQNARYERINKIMPFIIPLLTWSFIFGVALVVVFAYFQMNTPITT